MRFVILVIISYIVLGALGMYFGNRKVSADVARQRWLKYVAYLLITTFVVVSIWFHFFFLTALLIVLAGCYEIIKTIYKERGLRIALLVYSIIAAGFIFFAFTFRREFQFFIYFQILAFDAFSQVVGQLIGRTIIAPKISPAKTAEGFMGGMFFCVLSAMLTSQWLGISLLASVLYGLLTALTGFAGDLLASFYKRIAGIKDYSNLLPGQGGCLDRFDSFMMTAFCYSIISLITSKTYFAF